MADGVVKVVIEGEQTVAPAATAAKDALGDLKQSEAQGQAGIKELGAETEKTTEKFITNRREVRAVGNELSETFGLGRLGGLMVGGVFAAIVAVTESIKVLKSTWDSLRETINGPIEIGIPPEAPAHISAAAEAWDQYATARAKVLAEKNSPESGASAREKQLDNELKLIHQVLTAEKEKALADLEFQRSSMSPELYKAARANIENIFGEAGVKADESNRFDKIVAKSDEAANLEIDSAAKMTQANSVKRAPDNVAKANEKYLDELATKGEAALKEINERIDLIKKVAKPDEENDYAGGLGEFRKIRDRITYYQRYGGTAADFSGNLAVEEHRKAQAQALIDHAANYKTYEDSAQKKVKELTTSAGEESAKASGLREEVVEDTKFNAQQNSTDSYVASLHQQSATKIAGASAETTAALQNFLDTTLNGFADIHRTLRENDAKLRGILSREASSRSSP